jgi:hypothetical protein
LPADQWIPQAIDTLTHGVTIRRAPRDVWPWLMQTGAGSRGGWYSYDWLDNGRQPSATRIVPELQRPAVGTVFPALPGVTEGFVVMAVEPERMLTLVIATIVMSIFIVAVMAFGVFAHGMRFRLYSFATIATVVVFGAWAGLLARPMPGPTPWLGLAERVTLCRRKDPPGHRQICAPNLLEIILGGLLEQHFIWFGPSLESTAAARLMQVHR